MGDLVYALRHIGATDVVDIVLVALFLFVLLDWLRHHVSFRGLAVFAILILIQIFAIEFNLYMTRIVTQVALVLLVIIWLIVFQPDIRRTVDRIAIWGATRQQVTAEIPLINMVTQSASDMAEQRMGALICLRGDEPWDRHIEGGIVLNGRVSRPLLISIFSTTTPGHDGAMLIDGEEISRFAAHLPLSSNQQQIGQHGTRHAAALGLSEVCDALVIVVSEEHGTISVAHHGTLTRVTTGELKARLEAFVGRHRSRARILPGWWRRPAVSIALIALGLALFARMSLFMTEPVHRTYPVPVELSRVPSGLHLIDPPTHVKLTISGSENAFRLLNPAQLAVRLDVGQLDRGMHEFTIGAGNVNLPDSLALVQSDPAVVYIRAEQKH